MAPQLLMFDTPQPLTAGAIVTARARGAIGSLRYLSTRAVLANPRAPFRAKDLTAAEALLGGPGWAWMVVWELAADAALGGRSQGEIDARAAVAQAGILGMPSGARIFYAVDFDPGTSRRVQVQGYAAGTASVTTAAGFVPALYAPGTPLMTAIDAGTIAGPQWLTGGSGMSGYAAFRARNLPYVEQRVNDPDHLDPAGNDDLDIMHPIQNATTLAGFGAFTVAADGKSLELVV